MYWFHCMKATEIKLQKHCYVDNSMGFQPAGFLYSGQFLLCPICFKCTLLQVIWSSFSIHKSHTHKITHARSVGATQRAHKDIEVRTHSNCHHSPRKRILKVCFTKLKRGGRIFSFSPSSRRCVFERESRSGAGQVISLSQWESTPWNSPREARKAAYNIPPLPLSKLSVLHYAAKSIKKKTCQQP